MKKFGKPSDLYTPRDRTELAPIQVDKWRTKLERWLECVYLIIPQHSHLETQSFAAVSPVSVDE